MKGGLVVLSFLVCFLAGACAPVKTLYRCEMVKVVKVSPATRGKTGLSKELCRLYRGEWYSVTDNAFIDRRQFQKLRR